MSLTISHYRITGELGRGGMGIVYRAEDTRLDRTVALKVLPPHALSSEDDRARFYREARAAAKLSHAHICHVYQVDEAVLVEEGTTPAPDGEKRPFIAMEFVDGESLAERIAKGPLKLEEAIRIATEVALALGAAHEAGVVHRDVKSGNVMLTKKGEAKVLDFGLAKTAASTQLTRQGSTLGTVAYMSPEQARGEEVDRRTDLWALGVVLYEMIAGRLPFAADYEQAALYGILNEDPEPLTGLRAGVPMGIEWIVQKLLAKRASDRYQHAGDLLVDLRTVDLGGTGMTRVSSATRPATAPSTRRIPSLRAALLGAVGLLALVAAWWLGSLGRPADGPVGSFKRIEQQVPVGGVVASMDISPRGDRIVFVTDAVRVLELATGEMRSFDFPTSYVHVAFSPDGEELLLTSAAGIDRMSVSSGSVVHVADTREGGPRAEWADGNTIVYEEDQSIFALSLTTGESRPVIVKDTLNGEYDIDFPFLLPDGETLVATAEFRNAPSRIGFWELDSGRNLGYVNTPGVRVQWDYAGHLVFSAEGNAMAMPFDLDRLEQTGPVFQVDARVRPEGLSVSQEGTIVHVGEQIGVASVARPIVPLILRYSRASAEVDLGFDVFPAAIYRNGVVHPDGRSAAVVVQQPSENTIEVETDIWILDFEAGTRRAVTRGGRSDFPAWSPSGDSLYFVATDGDDRIMVLAASGRGGEQVAYETTTPSAWDLAISPDGKWAAYSDGIPPTMDSRSQLRLWRVNDQSRGSLADPNRINTETPNGNPRHFAFSPSSKYLAYEDQGAIFVQSLDDLDSTPYPVFENSMDMPRWAPDESKLFVIRSDGSGVSVDIETDPVFRSVGTPVVMNWYVLGGALFDIFPDGSRFLVAYPAGGTAPQVEDADTDASVDVHFILNLESYRR